MRSIGLFAVVALMWVSCGTTSAPCSNKTCSGCCSADGQCRPGNAPNACGASGLTCVDCLSSNLACSLGTCVSIVGFTGGGTGSTGGGYLGTGGGNSSTGGGSAATGGGGSVSTGGGSASTGGGSVSTGGGLASTGGGSASTGGGSASTGGGSASGGGGGGSAVSCSINNGGCSAQAICTPSGTTRICTCKTGYVGDGFTCTDVDECLTSNGGCDVNATCTNTPGSHTCACKTGYTGDGVTCTPIWTIETASTIKPYTAAIAVDSTGTPAIAFTKLSTAGFLFIKRQGAANWSATESIDTTSLFPYDASFVASGDSFLAGDIDSSTPGAANAWRRSSNGTWVAGTGLPGADQLRLAVGGGREHVLIVQNNSDHKTITINYTSRAIGSTAWATQSNIVSNAIGSPSIAANAAGNLSVLFELGDKTLWWARSSGLGTTWELTHITTTAVSAQAVAVDGTGNTLIAYQGATKLMFESWATSGQTLQRAVETGSFNGLSMAVDGAGAAHLAYLAGTTLGLRYAKYTSAGFTPETAALTNSGGTTGIAVDSTGAPHITFVQTDQTLGYAVRH